MQRHWMPMYWGDFLRDTRHLTKLERDSYLMLIAHYWTMGSLPDDDKRLALITDCTLEEWQIEKPALQAFFYDGWKHKRVEAELRRYTEKLTRLREAGQKGGLTASMNREKLRWQNQRLR